MPRAACFALCLVACARPAASGSPPSAKVSITESSAPSVPPPAPEPIGDWVESVRAEDFREAERRLSKLDGAQAGASEVKYARARVCMALGDFKGALALLDGLEADLPLLRSEITRDRAEASLEAGPYDQAARFFSSRTDAPSIVKAAIAYERGGDAPRARVLLDRVIQKAPTDSESRAAETSARRARARLAEVLHDKVTAAIDFRWLAVEAPASDAARDAFGTAPGKRPAPNLTSDERLTRAKKLAEAGRLDDALTEIDAASAQGAAAPIVLHARGWAYYVARADYRKASELLEQASLQNPKERVRDAFFAARALSRAQEDEKAIERYEALSKSYPGTTFAEEALYQAARLRFLLGDWDKATRAYKTYLDAFKKNARFETAARYELALTALAAQRPKDAVDPLKRLADSEDDPLERASLRELEGVALGEAGERDRAIQKLSSVLVDRPLSYPALLAVARIGVFGGKPPTPLFPQSTLPRLAPLTIELPAKVALLSRLGLVRDAERELAAHEGEFVARYAPRGNEALCEAYGKIGAGAERYRAARRVVRGDTLDHAPSDATRWAWQCLYPTPFDDMVRAEERKNGLPLGLLHAVMRQESAFKPDALSSANAVGLLQLIPGTAERVAREIGVEPSSQLLRMPAENMRLGAHYLHKVLETFAGHVVLAAAAYNAGPRAVSRWLELAETLPLDVWVARIPFSETRGYVARVVENLARYSYLRDGEAGLPILSLEIPRGRRAGPEDY
jgi:soluble lytic murein transglycosylase